MLEDNAERIERFTLVLRSIAPELQFRLWRDAHQMIREAGPFLEAATLISLDHDLEVDPGQPDPGDGYLVAQWLSAQPVVRPVILHSSNAERVRWMAGAFDLAGWRHWRVAPIGDDWIEMDWRTVVTRLLKQFTAPDAR